MMSDYVYPKDVLPEMEYDEPIIKQNRCGNCRNSIVTNPGAIRPGLRCRVMTKLFEKKNIENGNGQVGKFFGSCKFHNMTLKSINQALQDKEVKKRAQQK